MGCCCSSDEETQNGGEINGRRTNAETDAIPFKPNPSQIATVRVYTDDASRN